MRFYNFLVLKQSLLYTDTTQAHIWTIDSTTGNFHMAGISVNKMTGEIIIFDKSWACSKFQKSGFIWKLMCSKYYAW